MNQALLQMRRAAKIDANQPAIVDGLRRLGYRVQSLASVGQGVPDLLVGCPDGRLVLLEVKDGAKPPSARKLTPDEEAWHAVWRCWPVFVVDSLESALSSLRPADG